jgi:hypothetical protein
MKNNSDDVCLFDLFVYGFELNIVYNSHLSNIKKTMK